MNLGESLSGIWGFFSGRCCEEGACGVKLFTALQIESINLILGEFCWITETENSYVNCGH